MIKQMKEEKEEKSNFQIIASFFVTIIGITVVLITGNTMMSTMTGNVAGSGVSFVSLANIGTVIWGLLIILAGIWMYNKKNFHKSIFDK